MLSEYQLKIMEDKKRKIEKYIPNLKNLFLIWVIKKYKLRYQNLKLYLKLGLLFKVTQRVLQFKQTPF